MLSKIRRVPVLLGYSTVIPLTPLFFRKRVHLVLSKMSEILAKILSQRDNIHQESLPLAYLSSQQSCRHPFTYTDALRV